jgi:hypothetical protein
VNERKSAVHARVSFVVSRGGGSGGVRAAVCVSFSAKKKSVLKKSLLEARGGDKGVMFHTRVRELSTNWYRFVGGGMFVGVVAVRNARS